MHKRLLTSFVLGSLVVFAPAAAFAQATTVLCRPVAPNMPNDIRCNREIPLARVVAELYRSEIEANQGSLVDLDDAFLIARELSTQLTTFPLGSSAGGFTWTFDPAVGTFTRTTASFGPIFADRALTVGRHKLNVGLNYQRTTPDELEGLSLRDREIRFLTPINANLFGEDTLSLDVSADNFGIFVNYGITNRLDVGVAMPITRVKLDASVNFRYLNAAGQPSTANTLTAVTTGGRSKTGVGDIVVRAKYNVLQQPGGGVAAGFDLRLPTGDEDNLLGIPGTQAKLFGIYSIAFGMISPHANFGYTFSKGNSAVDDPLSIFLEPPDEINYAAGVDIAVHPRVTLAADLVGRTLRDTLSGEQVNCCIGSTLQEFNVKSELENKHLPLTSLGVKYNLWGNFLLTGNVLFPLTKNGLRDKFTPLIGFDYSF
jgi:hypothetical protein